MKQFAVRARRASAGLLAVVLLAVAAPAASATGNVIVNGGFETGSLSGWGHAPGHPFNAGHGWFAVHARISPSGWRIPAPPSGRFQAISDQIGPGSNTLFQTFRVPAHATLSMTLWYRNRAGVFFSPRMLVPDAARNQQLRITLTRPDSGLYSLKPADVLATVFATEPGDPASLGPRQIHYDLSALAGQLVRLRITEVDNQFFFQVGVDNVTVSDGSSTAAVPLSGAAASMTGSFDMSKAVYARP
ncbi:MAG TPA: hypothetical protein VE824_01905 [Gaiellales bacterium]|nr:hypothetical protein [Gaiellales bacterium]